MRAGSGNREIGEGCYAALSVDDGGSGERAGATRDRGGDRVVRSRGQDVVPVAELDDRLSGEGGARYDARRLGREGELRGRRRQHERRRIDGRQTYGAEAKDVRARPGDRQVAER